MEIKFKELKLQNFKSHQESTVNFGERTVITGDNAKGKSTVLEGPSWLLYGTDTLGSKMEPTPVTYESDETLVKLMLEVNGKETLLGRELRKGKTKYLINEVPSKATEFNEIVDQLFEKNMYLSLYNPNYFFTMHWEKQREMILNYVPAPANKEVFKALPEAQAKKLSELVKKHSINDLEKLHRDKKNKLDKQYIAAQSRTKTIKEQLEEFEQLVPLPSLRVEDDQLGKQIEKIQETINQSADTNRHINDLNNQIFNLNHERDRIKAQFIDVKGEDIEEYCRTCKQPLQEGAVRAVKNDQEKRMDELKAKFDKTVSDRKKLEEELTQLEYVDVSKEYEQIRESENKRAGIAKEIDKHNRLEAVEKQLSEAKNNEKDTLQSLNESIFIIDSIKDFHAKEAELQAKKVQDLFENLSIKLFKEQKNGEIKPTFEIQMDGKDYSKLSLSESIRAGLELREVLSEQSDIVAPVFLDNAESITKFKEPSGQLIMAKVVAGQELEVKIDD